MEKLYHLIEKKMKEKQRVIIAIDGPAASGKSTLSDLLKDRYEANVFRMDDFFLPPVMKTKERLNEIGGNVHYERFEDEVLKNLSLYSVKLNKFNCMTNELETPININLKDLIIIEGSYSLHKNLRNYYDIKVLLDVSRETQLKRLEARNPRLLQRFIDEWIPLEDNYFSHEALHEIVDIILSM